MLTLLIYYSFAQSWKGVTGNDLWPPRSLVWQNLMFYYYVNRFFFSMIINFTCNVTMFVVLCDKVNKQLSYLTGCNSRLAVSQELRKKSPLPCSQCTGCFVLAWSKSGNRKCSVQRVDILPVGTAFWFIIQKCVINFSSHVKVVD